MSDEKKWENRMRGPYQYDEVVSALQKTIRRGLEREALFWAFELAESGFQRALWRRLQVIASEDVGMADPMAAVLVNSMIAGQAVTNKSWTASDVRGDLIAHAVMYLCRAPKNRTVDEAYGLTAQRRRHGWELEMPDYAVDVHTARGKDALRAAAAATGRSYHELAEEKFFQEGAVLCGEKSVPGPDYKTELMKLVNVTPIDQDKNQDCPTLS